MPYAIAFDIDTAAFMDVEQSRSQRTQLYNDVRDALASVGFNRLQGSVYASQDDDLGTLIRAVNALRNVPHFVTYVREVHAFQMHSWSDMISHIRD